MSIIKKLLKVIGGLLVLLLIGGAGFYFWAKGKSADRLSKTYTAHAVEIPVPYPLDEAELARLRAERAGEQAATGAGGAKAAGAIQTAGDGNAASPDPLAGVDLKKLALERALVRGEHLVRARYACVECHGQDFGGGTMMDGMPVAQLYGANITRGKGSKVLDYRMADWDRIVRHGIRKDGLAAAMPSEDYFLMTDQELSDIVAYIRAQPPVDRESRPSKLGPLGHALMGLGKIPLSAERVADHRAKHVERPPPARDDVAFGKHLMGVCTGCHRQDLTGGKMAGGDPSWPPIANITMHADGLAGWTYEDFVTALQQGKAKDGTPLRVPMSLMVPYAKRMTETELRAMWTYIQSVEKKPTSK